MFVLVLLLVSCLAFASLANAAGGISIEFYGGTSCWDCYSYPAYIYTPPPVVYYPTRQVEIYNGTTGSTYQTSYYYDSGVESHHYHKHHKKHKKHKKHKHDY